MEVHKEKKPDMPDDAQSKEVTVMINGRPFKVAKDDLSFSDIVTMSNQPTGPNVSYTITFRRGHGNKPEGSLVEGNDVKVKDGMIINVTATDKS